MVLWRESERSSCQNDHRNLGQNWRAALPGPSAACCSETGQTFAARFCSRLIDQQLVVRLCFLSELQKALIAARVAARDFRHLILLLFFLPQCYFYIRTADLPPDSKVWSFIINFPVRDFVVPRDSDCWCCECVSVVNLCSHTVSESGIPAVCHLDPELGELWTCKN